MRLPGLSTLVSPALSEAISGMRQRISQTSEEAVTGRHADLTRHLGGQIGEAMLGQKAVDDIARQKGILSLRETRLDLVQRNLTVMQEAASGLGARLESAIGLGDLARQTRVAQDSRGALEQIFTALNARHGERYLFAGDATATPPFPDPETLLADIRALANAAGSAATFEADVSFYFNDPAGPWQQTIYSGTPTASDPDAVIGVDPAITGLVSGLVTLALARPEEGIALFNTDPSVLRTAAGRILSGETGLTNLRSDRGTIQQNIARAQASLDLEETILTRNFNTLTARDQFEAAAALRELETNLEASYLLTARLSNLSLLNFLR